jgi:hypothetical protein
MAIVVLAPWCVLSLRNALEWTRTTTGREAHKALKLVRPLHTRSPASKSFKLRGFADASDASGGASVATVLPRARRHLSGLIFAGRTAPLPFDMPPAGSARLSTIQGSPRASRPQTRSR